MIRFEKIVSALPGNITADTLYAVRVGDGFDLYVSDSTGSVAHKVNQTKNLVITGNRWSLETDNRWVTNSDDYYGSGSHNANESAGTGVDPEIEWEHLGDLVTAGSELRNFYAWGSANSIEVTDIEFALYKRSPVLASAWDTGIDADAEMTNTELWRGSFFTPTGITDNTGAKNAKHLLIVPLNITFAETAEVSLYLKPSGTLTTARFWRCKTMIEIIN